MASITIKDIPRELHEKIKRRAKANRRSLNSEVIECLSRAVGADRLDPKAFLEGARALRGRVSGRLTDVELAEMRTGGRP